MSIGFESQCDDSDQLYALVYVYYPRPDEDLPLLEGSSFTSAQLEQGVEWPVPEGYRCAFELRTAGNAAIHTKITLNNVPVHEGPCSASGPAGVAGYWTVTAARLSS